MNPDVDAYIAGSEQWPDEMRQLRPLLLDLGLTEELEWGKPTYCHQGKNVVILQEMKDFLALMFFKGALLSDPEGVLEDQGPNSRSARRMRFTSAEEIDRLAGAVRARVTEAIAVEDAGLEVEPTPDLVLADELQSRLDRDPELGAAFEALTPGRRREYNLHVSGAKQAETREARVDRCAPRILAGKGLRDR